MDNVLKLEGINGGDLVVTGASRTSGYISFDMEQDNEVSGVDVSLDNLEELLDGLKDTVDGMENGSSLTIDGTEITIVEAMINSELSITVTDKLIAELIDFLEGFSEPVKESISPSWGSSSVDAVAKFDTYGSKYKEHNQWVLDLDDALETDPAIKYIRDLDADTLQSFYDRIPPEFFTKELEEESIVVEETKGSALTDYEEVELVYTYINDTVMKLNDALKEEEPGSISYLEDGIIELVMTLDSADEIKSVASSSTKMSFEDMKRNEGEDLSQDEYERIIESWEMIEDEAEEIAVWNTIRSEYNNSKEKLLEIKKFIESL